MHILTAREFGNLPDPGHPQELWRGTVVDRPVPYARHGQVCGQVLFDLMSYTHRQQLGHVICNSGVLTERDPDTVRGTDVCYYSFATVSPGPLPSNGYLDVPPDAVFDVLSPSDRWPTVHQKIAEFLHLGVAAVYVFDPESSQVHAYFSDGPGEVLTADDELVGIGALNGLRVPVAKFFA